ncbi:MAG TPA: hypothetical protein P5048_01260 [Chlamydiales bacterium]|nr:hypothetical protein [Chlamydiales bacterium]
MTSPSSPLTLILTLSPSLPPQSPKLSSSEKKARSIAHELLRNKDGIPLPFQLTPFTPFSPEKASQSQTDDKASQSPKKLTPPKAPKPQHIQGKRGRIYDLKSSERLGPSRECASPFFMRHPPALETPTTETSRRCLFPVTK